MLQEQQGVEVTHWCRTWDGSEGLENQLGAALRWRFVAVAMSAKERRVGCRFSKWLQGLLCPILCLSKYPAACPACFQLFKRAGLVWAGLNPGMDRPASLEGESKGSEVRWPTPQPWGGAWRGDLRASLSEQKKQGCSHLVLVQLCLQRPRLKSQLPWGGSGQSPELFVCWQSCQAPHGEFFLFAHKSCPW